MSKMKDLTPMPPQKRCLTLAESLELWNGIMRKYGSRPFPTVGQPPETEDENVNQTDASV